MISDIWFYIGLGCILIGMGYALQDLYPSVMVGGYLIGVLSLIFGGSLIFKLFD